MNASSVSTVTQTATTAAASSGPALFTLFKLVFIFGVLLIALYFVWQKKNPGRRFDLRAFGQQLYARVKHFLEEEDAEEEEDEPMADKSPSFKHHPAVYGLYLMNILDYHSNRTMVELDDANLEPGDYIQIGYTNNPGQQHKRCRQSIALKDYGCTLAKTLPENNAIVVFRDPNNGQLYVRFSQEAKVTRQDMDSNGKPVISPINTKNDVPLAEVSDYLNESIFYVSGLPIAFSVNHRFAKNDGTPNIASFSKRGESYFDIDLPEKNTPTSKKKAVPAPDDDLPFVHNP